MKLNLKNYLQKFKFCTEIPYATNIDLNDIKPSELPLSKLIK